MRSLEGPTLRACNQNAFATSSYAAFTSIQKRHARSECIVGHSCRDRTEATRRAVSPSCALLGQRS